MKRKTSLVALFVALLASSWLLMNAWAHNTPGPEVVVANFEVDHDQTAGTHGLSADDWNTVITTSGTFNQVDCRGTLYGTIDATTFLSCDDHSQGSALDRSVFSQSDKVFDLEYDIKCGNVPKKDDQANIYAALRDDTASGHQFMIAGQERLDVNGDSHINFVMIRNSQPQAFPACPHDDVFMSLTRTEGDVLVAVDYSGGGTTPLVRLFVWDAAPLGVGTPGGPIGETADDCPGNAVADPGGPNEGCWNEDTSLAGVVATINFDGVDGGSINPSDPNDKDDEIKAEFPSVSCERVTGGDNTQCEIKPNIPQRGFVEIAVDLTENNLAGGCAGFGTLWTETRSSDSLTAQLKDISDLRSVDLQCSIEVTKTGDELSKIGDEVTYDIQVCNTSSASAPDLDLVSVIDDKLGTLSSSFPATLSPGECSDVESFNHTIPEGADDPYVNIVEAIYDDDEATAFLATDDDDHSVNLFQPSVEVIKEGDTLSKVGDTVTYDFTINNTSSLDSPDLILDSISDTVLGDLADDAPAACDVLAPGASCSFSVDFVIPDNDPDPLVNTVTVHYHPDAFLNDVWDDDGHSVELFTAEFSIAKDCQPRTAALGDTITYTYTLTNLSSDDAPNLNLVSMTDAGTGWAGLGDLTDEATAADCDVLSYAEVCSFQVTRDVQAGDPNPLCNTVTATYQVDGFENQYTHDASCDVDLVGCALSPGFWGGGEGRNKWDQLTSDSATSDLIAWTAGFSTSTCFPWVDSSVVDPTPGDTTCIPMGGGSPVTGLTYLDVLKLSSQGGDPTLQLGFKYVAAKLNQAAFGVPASTADLLLEIEDFFDAGGADNADLVNATDLYTQPVGSNPSGAAKQEAKRLKGLLDGYFSSVGEAFCPATGDIPELE